MGDMSEVNIAVLQQAVERLHECEARAIGAQDVTERFQGQTVWEGTVYIFALEGHHAADVAYAWWSSIEGSEKRKFFAVLHAPPIMSPVDAVRAAIIAEHRAATEGG
jgi:hypothetical protein